MRRAAVGVVVAVGLVAGAAALARSGRLRPPPTALERAIRQSLADLGPGDDHERRLLAAYRAAQYEKTGAY